MLCIIPDMPEYKKISFNLTFFFEHRPAQTWFFFAGQNFVSYFGMYGRYLACRDHVFNTQNQLYTLIIPGIFHFSPRRGKVDIKQCDWHETPGTNPFPSFVNLDYELCWTLEHFRRNLVPLIYVKLSTYTLFVLVFDLFWPQEGIK